MHSNYAVLDKYFNILSGSPEFFAFVGETTHCSLYSFLDSASFHEVGAAHREVLEHRTKQKLFVKMTNSKNKQKDCYIIISPYDGEEEYVYFEIYDMDILIERQHTLISHTAVLQSVPMLRQIIMIEYILKTKNVYLYICNEGNVYELFKGNLQGFKAKVAADKNVEESSMPDFERLISLFENEEKDIEVSLDADPFAKGEYHRYTIRANVICINNHPEVIGGTMTPDKDEVYRNLFPVFEKDSMTGLLNKNAIISYAKDRLRMRDNQNVTIAMMDLDNFKQVNDTLGHGVGDKLIHRFADIIKTAVGGAGAIGRFGGDEFMVVVDDMEDVAQLRQYFRSIRSNTELAFRNVAPGLNVTCSIGIAQVERLEGEITYDALFKCADTCLYVAKEFGKNRYVIYDDRTKQVIGNSKTIGQLRQNRFELNADFNFKITNLLFEHRIEALPDVVKLIGETLALNNVNIFLGDDLKLVYHWGCENTENINADYVFTEGYTKNFNENNVFYLMSVQTLEAIMPDAYKNMKAQNIYSAMQYIIYYDGKPIGLISFELPQPGRYWHQNEMNSFIMICPLISQLLVNRYINE